MSLAVAASCIENAQNLELATLLAGQIARAAAIFNIDEVRGGRVQWLWRCCGACSKALRPSNNVLQLQGHKLCPTARPLPTPPQVVVLDDALPPGAAPGHVSSAAAFFARVLQFMETPQYLKK